MPEKLIVPTLPATPTPPEPSGADISESYTRRTQFVPLDNPTFISGNKATFLRPYDRVLGIKTGGASRAYPINMMTYHHIANDVVGGKPILITF